MGYRLGWQDYWWDEHVTLMFTRVGWRELMIDYWALDTHRPVYYGLQKLWNGWVGESVVAVRSLPVLLMLPVIAIFFFAARRINDGALAPITALLMATAPMFVEQGREVRMYSLTNLALAMTFLLAVTLAERARRDMRDGTPPGRGTALLWIGVALSMALAFYAQPLAALVALLFGLWVVISTGLGYLPRRFLTQALGAALLFGLLILPALPPFFAHLSGTLGQSFWVPEPSVNYIYTQTAAIYPFPKWIKPVAFILLVWGLWSLRDKPHVAWLAGVMIIGLPVLVLAISFAKPIYMARVIAWSSIVSVLVLAAGLAALRPGWRWSGVAVLTGLQLMAAQTFYPAAPEHSDVKEIAEALEGFDPETDILILGKQQEEAGLRWYAPEVFESGAVYGFTYGDSQDNVIDRALRSTHVMRADAAEIRTAGRRLFVIYEIVGTSPVAPEDSVAGALEIVTQGRIPDRSITTDNLQLDIHDPPHPPPARSSGGT
jgi:hypothetical protein